MCHFAVRTGQILADGRYTLCPALVGTDTLKKTTYDVKYIGTGLYTLKNVKKGYLQVDNSRQVCIQKKGDFYYLLTDSRKLALNAKGETTEAALDQTQAWNFQKKSTRTVTVVYSQYDPEYRKTVYKDGNIAPRTISTSGCGVMALVTSKGTMDKENSNVRKYIAQRAELLGAIRLPNDTFKGNAGTEVVSDILFLQKRDRLIDIEPDWVHLDTDENGIRMNSYFVQHPEMILGEMKMVSGRFGPEATCEPFDNADLSELLNEAVSNIHGEISEYEVADELEEEDNTIPADPMVRNFSYTVLDDKIYFRENSRMSPVEVSATAENRIKGMIGIRDCVRNLIELQTEDYPDSEIKQAQEKLNTLYDSFTKKYGLINSRANTSAFSDDSSYALLSALEVLDENGELERKADMFFKRTIKPHKPVREVDTADEALAVSMGEKAAIDMEYMMELSGKSEEELFSDLKCVIFLNPLYEYGNSYEPKYLMADEYLSGNVREKLATAKRTATLYPEDYTVNVQALEKVQPKDLTASEISVRLGATWIPPEIFQQFMFEFLDTPRYAQWNIKVHYSQFTGEWNIEGKSYDRSNVKEYSSYGTSRINAYKIIEETLNLNDVRIFDYIEDEEGRKKAVLNKKETAIAQAKQELIKQGFQDWIWADPTRREKLTKMYNEKFNSIRPREYDGSHIVFNGMNPEIELR